MTFYIASKNFKSPIPGKDGHIEVTVWAKLSHSYLPMTHESPEEHDVHVADILGLEGYATVYHDDYDLVGDSWQGCSERGGDYYVNMTNEGDIRTWLEAWGMDLDDPEGWKPAEVSCPDGPDPDDQRDEMLERRNEDYIQDKLS